jgi:uncharacterized protein YbcV (DUF1398 family)
MNEQVSKIAEACLHAAENNSMTFPEIVGKLIGAGFESYAIDFRRGAATYYLPSGDSTVLDIGRKGPPVAPAFDIAAVQSAIREAQALVPGYTYVGFCDKVMRAGCAGYLVSFSGRRAVYYGRTAETHVEHLP